MPDVPRLDLPRWSARPDDAAVNLRRVRDWASSRPMRELVREFGGSMPADNPAELLDYLDTFAGQHWDFRRGRERNLAELVTFHADREDLILEAAHRLGLEQRPAERQHYDTIIMTGGMVRAGVAKPRYVRLLLDEGVTADNVVFLGGFRAFAGDEVAVAAGLGVPGDNEFDAMVEGLRRAFGPLGAPEVSEELVDNPNASWREFAWQTPFGRVLAIAAPSSAPEQRRANTVDTYRFWAGQRRQAHERSVLIVTAPVYVPYQGAGAVEVLGIECGLEVETIGISRHTGHLGQFSQVYEARHYLQEMRSAIHAMRSLHRCLTPLAPPHHR